MSLAEEMLATMPLSDDSSTYSADEEPHIVINKSRQAIVPNELKTIAVTGDKNIETVTFDCVRYWDGNDLSTFAIFLNYVLPDLTTGTYIPEKITTTDGDEFYHFDWQIKNNITAKSGKISFAVTAVSTKPNSAGVHILDKKWSSLPNGDCSIALGLDLSNVPSEKESSDVLAQMSAILEQIQSNTGKQIDEVVENQKKMSEEIWETNYGKIPERFLLTSKIWENAILREDSSQSDGYYTDYAADRVMSDFIEITGQKCGKYIAELLDGLFLLVYKFDADKKYIGASNFIYNGDSVDINSDVSFIRTLIGYIDGTPFTANNNTWMLGRLVSIWAYDESKRFNEMSEYTTAEYFRRKYNKLPVDPKMWSQRSLLYTGRYNAISTRISTMAIPFNYSRIKVIPKNADYKVEFVFFDAKMNPIGNSGDWITSKTTFDVPEKTRYVAFCMARIDDQYIPVDVVETSPFQIIDISGVDAVDMKVMSYNIGLYNRGVRGGIPTEQLEEKIGLYKQFFVDSECDILAILEAATYMDADNTVSAPETLFKPLYQGSRETYDGWSAFYGKMPLRNLGLFNFAGTTRAVICADVTYKGKDIHIVCAHLTPGVGEETTREAQMQELIDHLKTKDRFILFGDFNIESISEFDVLKNAGYTSVNGGYLGWKKTYTTGAYYYDNIFVSDGIVVNKYDVPSVGETLTSDHLPFVASLTIM